MSAKLQPEHNEVENDLPTLGVFSAAQWMFNSLPRMRWMSSVLDIVEAREEFLQDPLKTLPPAARKLILELPHIAWITITLFLINSLTMVSIVTLAELNIIHQWFACVLLTLTMFVMFTVGHDAAHGSISNIKWINGIVGRLAFGTMGPTSIFVMFRYIHQMHHKFTNDKEKDPDRFCSHSSFVYLPIRCLLIVPYYFYFYMKRIHTRPILEIIEAVGGLGIQAGLLWGGFERGYGNLLMVYWIIPSTVSQGLLAFFFDFIPHHHDTATTPTESRYHTTSVLQTYWFAQPFVSLLMQYQDYHLIHHLYPTIPFYRYADKWIEKQEFLKEKNIPINHLTVEEVVKNVVAPITQPKKVM